MYNNTANLISVIFCTALHFWVCKLYTRKVHKFATKIASLQNSKINIGVLIGAFLYWDDILGVFRIGDGVIAARDRAFGV